MKVVPHYRRRNLMNARQSERSAYAIKSTEAEAGLVTRTAPDGVVEHFIDGVQVSSETAAAYESKR